MIDQIIIELPFIGLFIKFMIASTCLTGGVWLMEKAKIINTPDIAEMAWKLAIIASFIAVLPISISPSTITVPISEDAVTASRLPSPLASQTPRLLTGSNSNQTEHKNESDSEAQVPLPAPQAPVLASGTPHIEEHGPHKIKAIPAIDAGQTDQSRPTSFLTSLLLIGWSVLAAIALMALIVSYRRAINNLGTRKRVPAEHEANRALRAICETANIRHVPYLSRSDEINSPVCLPRREICLPAWAFDDMDDEALRSLIAHEIAHMLRRDPFQIIFLQTLCRICFFQPMFALARRRLEDCAELAADEWAANQLSSANTVAEALYTCAQKITQKRQIQWGLAMAGDKSILRQRVERLVHADSNKFDGASTFKRASVSIAIAGAVLFVPSIEFATAMNTDAPENLIISDNTELRLFTPAYGGETTFIPVSKVKVPGTPVSVRITDQSGSRTNSKTHISSDDDGFESGNMHWSDGERSIEASWHGNFMLSDDERSITGLSDGGELQIRTHSGDTKNRIRIEDNDGEIDITYWEQGQKQSFDDDAEAWFAETLQQLMQHTAIDMDNRVARYLEKGGTEGALNRMADIRSDYVKRMFAIEMIRQADFSEAQFKELLRHIRSLESDYEIRLTLLEILHSGMLSPDNLSDVLEVAENLESDYEMRLTLLPLLERFRMDNQSMNKLLDLAHSIDSDYELRLLLSEAAMQDFSVENAKKLLDVTRSIESDYELRLLLEDITEIQGMTAELNEQIVTSIKNIEGDYERRLALEAIAETELLSDKAWMDIIQHARDIGSNHEKRLILDEIRDQLPENDALHDAWTKAAQSISSKHERRLLLKEDN